MVDVNAVNNGITIRIPPLRPVSTFHPRYQNQAMQGKFTLRQRDKQNEDDR